MSETAVADKRPLPFTSTVRRTRIMAGGSRADRAPTAPRRVVVVGASAGVGRALAEQLAAVGSDLLLVATDRRDLAALANDLRLRFGGSVHTDVLDLRATEINFEAACESWRQKLQGCDALLCPAGYFSPDDDGLTNPEELETTLRINFTSIAGLLSACGRAFEQQGFGSLVVFSSIAAAAPRRKRMAYAAAKTALETYAAGLRHYFSGTPVRVQVYVLGYVDTAMSFGQKLLLPPVAPEALARYVVANLDHDLGRRFYPRYWRWITAALRALPWCVFRRLKF